MCAIRRGQCCHRFMHLFDKIFADCSWSMMAASSSVCFYLRYCISESVILLTVKLIIVYHLKKGGSTPTSAICKGYILLLCTFRGPLHPLIYLTACMCVFLFVVCSYLPFQIFYLVVCTCVFVHLFSFFFLLAICVWVYY